MHLIERFHRIDYGNMEMDVTIEDPGVFTKPWSFHRTTTLEPNFGFNEKTWLDSTGKPYSGDMHLIERYRRPDLGHLNVAITIEDPKAFTKPYSFTRTFTLAPAWELQEYVCQAVLDGVYE